MAHNCRKLIVEAVGFRGENMLSRLVSIIYILLHKGTVTAGELAGRFEVSVRTIYRDVEKLSLAGIPVYARKGRNGGISLTEGFVLDKMMLSGAEQQRIFAALASLRETGAQDEEDILQKLGTFFKADIPDWVAIDFSDWSGRRRELFEQIRDAILKRRVLTFDYYGQYGEMSHRTAEPVQLLFKEYTWYVRAYCRTRQAMRLFKVLRMKHAEVSEETFEAVHRVEEPECGEISLQNAEGAVGPSCGAANGQGTAAQSTAAACEEIVLRVDKKEAYRVYDRFEEEEIMPLPEGDFLIRMNCFPDDWVYGVILSFGPSAKVLSPEYVRKEIAEKIRAMGKNYL